MTTSVEFRYHHSEDNPPSAHPLLSLPPLPPPPSLAAAAARMAKQLRQARAIARATRDYLRYDLPEIIFPSSLPNPPGYVPETKQHRDYIAVSAWGLFPADLDLGGLLLRTDTSRCV